MLLPQLSSCFILVIEVGPWDGIVETFAKYARYSRGSLAPIPYGGKNRQELLVLLKKCTNMWTN